PLVPILFSFFFLLVVPEVVIVLVFVFLFLGRFQLQGAGADDFQISAAFIATDVVAFVYIFFIDIDGAFAFWTSDHEFPPKIILLYDRSQNLQVPISKHLGFFTWRPVLPAGAGWLRGQSPSFAGTETFPRDASVHAL